MLGGRTVGLMVRACHPGPTAAVTVLAVLLAVASRLSGPSTVAVGITVLAGQLSIGWSNDLLDAGRDRQVGRVDKPLATGALSSTAVLVGSVAAVGVSALASVALGPAAAAAHLLLVVGAGWAYNLGLKRTVASFVPYAIAFGTLPAVVHLARPGSGTPPVWLVAAGALLGVGAHLVNALPDLADDATTGVTGLPHRLGDRGSRAVAAVLLVGGTLVAGLGPAAPVPPWVWAAVPVVAVLAVAILIGRGSVPFRAAVAVALVDVAVLVGRSVDVV